MLAHRHADEGTHPIVTQCFHQSLIYPSKPKISNLYNSVFFSFSHDQYVRRLETSMDNLIAVKIVEAVEQLPQQGFDSVGVNGGV